MVPEEPTKAMLDALAAALDVGYLDASEDGPKVLFNPRAAWKAAVAKTPKRQRAGRPPGDPTS